MNQLNKIIIKTAFISFVGAFTFFAYFLGVFAVVFPQHMARFADALGNQRMSAMYHIRIFERSGDVEDLFNVVMKVLDAPRVICYTELLIEHEDFEDLIIAKNSEIPALEKNIFNANILSTIYSKYFTALMAVDRGNEIAEILEGVLARPVDATAPITIIIPDTAPNWPQIVLAYQAYCAKFTPTAGLVNEFLSLIGDYYGF
jgi:hypothetical protein